MWWAGYGCFALVPRPSKTAGVPAPGSVLNACASVDGEPAADGIFLPQLVAANPRARMDGFRKYAYEGVDLESESQ